MAVESADDVLSTALSLSVPERARLAQELLASLDGSADPEAAAAWLEEIERRARDVQAGRATLEPWAEVRQRLLGRWRPR